MAVRKRKNKGGIVWFSDLRYPNGERHRKTFATKREAQADERGVMAEIQAGTWKLKNADIRFDEFLNDYFRYTELNRARSTHRNDKYRIERNILPYFGNYKLRDISPELIEKYKQLRVREGATHNTVNHELANLSHIIKRAMIKGYVDRNVVALVEKFKFQDRSPKFLTESEMDKLLDAAQGEYIYPILVTALYTGMRKSELFNLKWENVDFRQRTVTIQSGDNGYTKNYRSRTIEMTGMLYKTMIQQRQFHLELRIQVDYVFTYRGHRIRYIDGTLKKVVRRAELEDVTLHTLRHTFASQLVMAGVSLVEVQQLMGHRSYDTTLQYAHLSEDHVKKQVNRLPFADGLGKNWAKMENISNLTRKKPVPLEVVKLNTGNGL